MRPAIVLLTAALACSSPEPTPPIEVYCEPPPGAGETYWCFSYGPYEGHGVSCVADADCPASISPCSQAECIDNTCGLVHAAPGASLCGDEALKCDILGACCGIYEVPT